jgi:hypothetical protein
MLELQASLHAVTLAADDDVRSQEADHFEMPTQFLGIPALPVMGFEGVSASRLDVDFVRHGDLLGTAFSKEVYK